MQVVRRIFRMIGSEHRALYSVKRTFEREGVPTPDDARFWSAKVIRNYVLDDVYKPHTHAEIIALMEAGQMSATVVAGLDPDKNYGIWWFNRRRTKRTHVSEPGADGKRTYRRTSHYVYRSEEEWVAVPVPDSGIPREWVDAAREEIKENRAPSAAGRRVWELSGGILRCGSCGYNMALHSVTAPRAKHMYFYYRCRKRGQDGIEACPQRKNHRADE